MSFDFSRSHFDLFAQPELFQIDRAALDARYRELQAQYHPDRYASAADIEKRLALQIATRINEAYQTLKSPLARGRYLLQLSGVETQEETNTAMPMDFLMGQMEWREAIAEAKASQNVEALERLNVELRGETDALEAELGALLDRAQYEDAAIAVRKLRFMEKLDAEIGNAIEAALF
ncbi:MAG TPA: Fe-S protein assembly co-chaperone HscB [Chitinolyticbacter sp.]|uniref:Fe-S protein assembly co-chaperone HscB n=1 Tax=Chitinolyticbacter albus TaxID=2961951 RepID=UPI00210C2A59|nr:Fe-S protein assembly co-chaperone HscB [Chitinolyticbacter albus]HSC81293.1 Fe-S protein assembly co-chaperone HscB [Chitinolyticbacter sp.]